MTEDGHAVIVVDTQDLPQARAFSLLHEYAHIVLRATGLCDLNEQIEIERYCNAVAANVLMPKKLLQSELVRSHRWGHSLTDDEHEVRRVADRLGVSQATLLIQLEVLGVIQEIDYDTLERRRAERRRPEGPKGGQYYPSRINRVGRRFASSVVGAYDEGWIDRPDAATLLEIPEHNFRRFRQELASSNRDAQ